MDQPTPPNLARPNRAGQNLTGRTQRDIREALEGRRHGWGAFLPFLGPAMVTSIAYIDPGNFATNIQAGARYGYRLLWVVVLANLIAMLFQALSAKLGIVTGRNLAELCRAQFPRPIVAVMWVVSEIAAMATDLAEFIGAAVGLALLFHLPLLAGMVITGIITYAILGLDRLGFRPIELVIGGFVAIIALCYVAELVIAPVDWGETARGLVPGLPDDAALLLAVGIIGATVMPHAVYLHSGLTQSRTYPRNDSECRLLIRFSHREVIVALTLAGLVNMAMVVLAANAFHRDHPEIATIETAYRTLVPLLGGAAAGIFLTSLIASGISSSTVGTMAGQMIMQGFVGFRIPVWVRRAVTMIPAFVIVALGVDATSALIASQVLLSLTLPIPMVALLIFTGQRNVMGNFANSWWVTTIATAGASVVLLLNLVLLAQSVGLANFD
jgi:manganese transport protein